MEAIFTLDELYNEDCISGCRAHLPDESVDLIVTDPPYGINGDRLHRHYNRKEEYVLDGYIEIPRAEYDEFSRQWIQEAERILRPGGSLYVLSGYTNLYSILSALRRTSLQEMNHIIWKYNFGVYTRNKYVSSHYHILFYTKPGAKHTFNTYVRYGDREKDAAGGSLNYQDREDVWIINREYKPGRLKNKNELPLQLLTKILQYSSRAGDKVCDLFLGSFATAKVALGMNRRICGFELSTTAFAHQMQEMRNIQPGFLLPQLRQPDTARLHNQNRPWLPEDLLRLQALYDELHPQLGTKQKTIAELMSRLGRGYFSILNALKKVER
jgi:site-specific DNA-methyltransferase (adenine-specific)